MSGTNEGVLTGKVWLGGIKLFLKIIFALFFVLFFVLASIFYISPATDAKIFKFLGFKRAEEACYVRVYQKSDSATDLYNLILFEMEQGNDSKEYAYIKKMRGRADYDEFCDKLDASAVAAAGDNKALYVYVADTRAFLINREVKICFNGFVADASQGWDITLINHMRNNLAESHLTETSFATLMNLVDASTALSAEQKASLVEDLNETWSNELATSTTELLETRVAALESAVSAERDAVQKILLQNALVKIYGGLSTYYSLLGNADKASEALSLQTSAKAEYNNLIS